MNPLAALYGGVVRARNDLYDRGTLTVRRLRGPVVSIGNVAVGGSGKTPFLIALGELLLQRGIAFDVLSRGYGRATHGVALVDPGGSPRDFGDEPLLIARKLRVPVIVGEQRYVAGQFAEQRFGPQLHLLDDGFQHRQLARDFDIVMVTPTDARDALLPAGRLREPLSSLARANAVVLTNSSSPQDLPIHGAQLWRVTRGIIALQVTAPCFAFCGIARPQNFFVDLRAAGIPLCGTMTFSDHHRYTRSDILSVQAESKRCAAAAFVTTEKDAINLASLAAELSPLHIVAARMQLHDSDSAVDAILARTGTWMPR
ncbi:MAG TPA: tetraacyldisaccharide 4'-kinase [Terriglobales bacterium]|nr:tetraacyldisaccharide 4'-kinase [Terriglobales bacterium]